MKRPKESDYYKNGVLKAVFYMKALEKYIDWLEGEFDEMAQQACEQIEDYVALEEETEQKIENMKEYAVHKEQCRAYLTRRMPKIADCTCGLEQILK